MKRHAFILALAGMMAIPAAAQVSESRVMDVKAQTDTTTTTVMVGHGAYTVTVPSDEPLVAWVEMAIVTPSGQFGKTYVIVQSYEGEWIKLTPCDDVVIPCEPVTMRVENVQQGKQFYLGS